jgi:hypothetical protein
MEKLILYCKSFRGDFERVKVLHESIQKYNQDNIPFYISVPKSDEFLFKQLENVNIIYDEDIYDITGPGWITQQIVKSSLWRLNICENYVLIDSDSYFIKPFSVKNFMYDDNTPYTVMHEQKELHTWVAQSKYNNLPFDPRESFKDDRSKIQNIFSREGRIYDFGPTPSIWNCNVWKSFEEEYIAPNNLTFAKVIEYCWSEFTWYGEWLLYKQHFRLWPIEPMFKVFHYHQQYQEYKDLGYTEGQISQHYLGIVLQSNWDKQITPLKY